MQHSRLVGGLAALAVLLILAASPAALAAPASPCREAPASAATARQALAALTGSHAARIAKRQLGVPYVFGGASREGFDAAGLTMFVYGRLGVKLPHGATAQQGLTKRIPLKALRRGDLVFWGSRKYSDHVAIYVGAGRVIHAPHAGDVVGYGTIEGAWTGGRLLPVR